MSEILAKILHSRASDGSGGDAERFISELIRPMRKVSNIQKNTHKRSVAVSEQLNPAWLVPSFKMQV